MTDLHGERRGTSAGQRPARILYVIDQLGIGGAEQHLVRLITGLLPSGRWHPSVYCLGRVGELLPQLDALGIEVVGPARRWHRSPAGTVRAVADLWRYVRGVRPDITHSYMPEPGLLGALASRLAGVPYTITTRRWVHSYGGLKLFQYRLSAALMDRCSDAIIAVCEAARQQAIREGTPPEKIKTVYNSVPLPSPTPTNPRPLEGHPVFGSVGRLQPYKGHRYLVEAAPLVLAELPDARFVLVGDGSARAQLERQAEELGVSRYISFLGERPDGADLLQHFDVFVLPSLVEGLPNAVLEAMAAGLPIVATGVGGVPELIEHGQSGLLVPAESSGELARAMVQLWRDESVRRRCAEAARETAATRFSVSREVVETEAIYLALLEGRDLGAAVSAGIRGAAS